MTLNEPYPVTCYTSSSPNLLSRSPSEAKPLKTIHKHILHQNKQTNQEEYSKCSLIIEYQLTQFCNIGYSIVLNTLHGSLLPSVCVWMGEWEANCKAMWHLYYNKQWRTRSDEDCLSYVLTGWNSTGHYSHECLSFSLPIAQLFFWYDLGFDSSCDWVLAYNNALIILKLLPQIPFKWGYLCERLIKWGISPHSLPWWKMKAYLS